MTRALTAIVPVALSPKEAYAVLGEGAAWIMGWSLILEYSVACSAVTVGWSGYMAGLLKSAGMALPLSLLAGPQGGGMINLPATLIVLAVTGLLVRETARR